MLSGTRLLLALLAAIPVLLPLPASGGEPALPAGLGKVLDDFAPPDLAGFPPGTTRIEVRHSCLRDAGPCRVSWVFESDAKGGPLSPREGEARALERGREPAAGLFPAKAPALGPLDSAKAALQAVASGDAAKARPFLCPEDRERLAGDPERLKAAQEERARELGVPVAKFADAFLPAALALPPRSNELELRFSFPGEAGGKKGSFEVRLALSAESEAAPNWVLMEFEPSFREQDDGPAPAGREPGAPRGLRALLGEFALPDLGSFPPGTAEVRIEGGVRQAGRIFSLKARFQRAGDGFLLDAFRVREREQLPEGFAFPARPPAEGPLESLSRFLEAARALDAEGIRRHLPSARRAEFDRKLEDRGIESFRADAARQEERSGFSEVRVLAENLPRLLRMPENALGLGLAYAFPGEAKGKKGTFRAGFGLFVEAPEAERWTVRDPKAEFEPAD
ncbi:MAG: hypothetical protein MUC63_08955 [Planctomycetes bacterium]|jgi:hypothetical protein|nr:hypothetical protein [Planctomycetota bacterium]